MYKFVKLKQFIADGEWRNVILNVAHIEAITPRENNRLCIWTASGDNIEISEDDWPMLGIEIVQELHSAWDVEASKKLEAEEKEYLLDHQSLADPREFARKVGVDICQGEPLIITEKLKDDVKAFFGVDMTESHRLGTQQYVKDES